MRQGSTILVPIDFSTFSRTAAECACVLAAACGAKIRLLHALHLPPIALALSLTEPIWSELRISETAKLEAFRHSLEGRGISVSADLEEADPVDAIYAAATQPEVELVVMGSHGHRGLDRLMLGSVAERTLQRSPVPVFIAREPDRGTTPNIVPILFATDFSEHAELAEGAAAHWARQLGGGVEVFHAIHDPVVLFAPYGISDTTSLEDEMRDAAHRRIESVVARFREAGVPAKAKIVSGFASDQIIKRADLGGFHLIAMGTRGYSGLRRYRLGSVVQRVLRHASCHVLVAGASGMQADYQPDSQRDSQRDFQRDVVPNIQSEEP
jgi:nucleotide-binding universal stress UspA family protein